MGAGECSGEHNAKHLSPFVSDPQSCRVDQVHCVPSSELQNAMDRTKINIGDISKSSHRIMNGSKRGYVWRLKVDSYQCTHILLPSFSFYLHTQRHT